MISGLGLFEILLVLLIVLMFFGSKELPRFIREAARLIGKFRLYSEKVRRELNDVTSFTNDISDPQKNFRDEVAEKKEKLRKECLDYRKSLTEEERKKKTDTILSHLYKTDEYKKAGTVLIYAATKTEVQTEECIKMMLSNGKRVILPYCLQNCSEMGIAEIKDFKADVQIGEYKILEPVEKIRNNFIKSDIRLVVCPGVGFDKNGARLGRGKGYYDTYLKDLKEKTPIVGFAYECQMLDEELPFDYHDIPMDMIITEEGIKRFNTDTDM